MGVCTNAAAPASFMGEGQETSAFEMVPALSQTSDMNGFSLCRLKYYLPSIRLIR